LINYFYTKLIKGGVVLKETKITETEFQKIIQGKRLTPNEEATLRENLELPYNETLPKSAHERKRLLIKAKLKVFRVM